MKGFPSGAVPYASVLDGDLPVASGYEAIQVGPLQTCAYPAQDKLPARCFRCNPWTRS